MRTALLALIGAFIFFTTSALAGINEDLRTELLSMFQEDQAARRGFVDSGMQDQELAQKVRAIDSRNTARLKKIIDEYGWPTKSLVGEDGAVYAFLIVQHADRDPSFQKRALERMQEIATRNPSEVFLQGIAFLTDRVRIANGQKQLYGTQFVVDTQTKEVVLVPVENPDGLESRRKAYGLPTIEESLNQLRDAYKLPKK